MYTSGPKKVAIFPPGFNPAAGGPGGLGAGLKQPINTGAASNTTNPGLGQTSAPMGGMTKQPMVGPSSTAPFSPKQTGVPLPKVGLPMQPKAPVKVPGLVSQQPPPSQAPPTYGPPKVGLPTPATQPNRYSGTP